MKIPAHQYEPDRYEAIFHDKARQTLPLFETFGVQVPADLGIALVKEPGGEQRDDSNTPLTASLHSSKPTHYRMRAEFRYGMSAMRTALQGPCTTRCLTPTTPRSPLC